MMLRHSIYIVCVFYVISKCAQAQDYNPLLFPCPIFDCPGGESCAADGGCECADDTYGARCETAAAGTCDDCSEEGTDKDVGGLSVCRAENDCICLPGYTGATCKTRMADVSCDQDTLTVSITPYSNAFEGSIYLAGDADADFPGITDAGCRAVSGDDTDGTYSFEIPLTGDVGDTAACRPVVGDGGAYEVHAYIQYDDLLVQEGDSVYKFSCTPGTALGANTINTRVVAIENRIHTPDISDFVSDSGAFNMTVGGGDGDEAVPDQLRVGDDLSLVIRHPQLFSLKSCTGYSYDPTGDDAGPDLDLITEWCDSDDARSILRGDVLYTTPAGGEDSYEMRIPFNAWYFVGTAKQVWIQCIGCIGTEGECDYTNATCKDDGRMTAMFDALEAAPDRRRRRAAEDEETTDDNIGTLAIRLTIDGEQYQAAGDATSNKSDKATTTDCYSRISVILPIILLAALLLVAMVMTFFFCVKVTRAYERSGEVNMAYKS